MQKESHSEENKIKQNENILSVRVAKRKARQEKRAARAAARAASRKAVSKKISNFFSSVFPENISFLTVVLFVIAAPYIAGALFLFIFISGGDPAIFSAIQGDTFIALWCVGYEIISFIVLIILVPVWLKSL